MTTPVSSISSRGSVTDRMFPRARNRTAITLMALILPLLALAVAAGTPSSAAAASWACGSNRSPGSGQVMLFEHKGYGGLCEVFTYSDIDLTDNLIGNDRASSIKVGAGIGVRLCQHNTYGGACTIFTGNDNNLSDNGIKTDRASSLAFGQRCTKPSPGRNEAFLYQHDNYRGFCQVFNVNHPDLTYLAIGLTTSSIKVGRGMVPVLCTRANYKGTCERFKRSDANLDGNAVGTDKARSIKFVNA